MNVARSVAFELRNKNVFRILGDVSHLVSKLILIWSIHTNRSAEGVSLLTQVLYLIIFVTRYLDLPFWLHEGERYLIFFKIFYIVSSLYIVVIMWKWFPRTREREKAWKLTLYAVAGSLLLGPTLVAIVKPERERLKRHAFRTLCRAFSLSLESVCILPQLLLLRQTTVPTVIDSFYLVTLGSYRAFYIINWIYRYSTEPRFEDTIAVIFGILQTALYIDFAWVYWSRQRVKLRNGGVVDAEDFRKGWLMNTLFNGRHARTSADGDGEEEQQRLHDAEAGTENESEVEGLGLGHSGSGNNRWGVRGISVSADDTLDNHSARH